ncbi:MAG: hypothetical protein PHZ07_00425 [Patescibacteria group bacterium]|nr:hypothetical protein [Patescibacteria group bacterium]MDD4304188.1 hypothetical protein [Patescibacteria group bacterium]MDD4695220.1 hypothetical protein [Patescibacteria group bacterium]
MNKDVFVIINPGSRQDEPCKLAMVPVTLEEGVYSAVDSDVMTVSIDYAGFPSDSEYPDKGVFISQKIYEYIQRESLNIKAIIFRCPALKKNIQGLTYLTKSMVEDMTPKNPGELADGLKIPHGSEIAAWVCVCLESKLQIRPIFSCGIPTNLLPEEVKVVGIPDEELDAVSHAEFLKGLMYMMARRLEITPMEFVGIPVMFGSGFGIYGWKGEKIVSLNVRQENGSMSQSSIGATVNILTLLRRFKRKGITDVDAILSEVAKLMGKSGGLCMFDPRYGDLKVFASDVREAMKDPNQEKNKGIILIFRALVYQVVSQIWRARGGLSYFGERNNQVTVYFFGGGSNWPELIEAVEECLGDLVFKFEMVDGDPEREFFIAEALKFLNGEIPVNYEDVE